MCVCVQCLCVLGEGWGRGFECFFENVIRMASCMCVLVSLYWQRCVCVCVFVCVYSWERDR